MWVLAVGVEDWAVVVGWAAVFAVEQAVVFGQAAVFVVFGLL